MADGFAAPDELRERLITYYTELVDRALDGDGYAFELARRPLRDLKLEEVQLTYRHAKALARAAKGDNHGA